MTTQQTHTATIVVAAYPSQPPGDYTDETKDLWTPDIGTTGSAHSMSQDSSDETAVERLRDVVAEVTCNRIPALVRRGPGFY